MEQVAGKKKRSSSSQYERQRLEVPELRPWGVPKYQVPAFADVRQSFSLNMSVLVFRTNSSLTLFVYTFFDMSIITDGVHAHG